MKKPRPIERPCPACNGTGMAPTKPPARPGVRIYAACKECKGKGRIIVD
jgi:DnaJ-class molecular chaperone